MRRQVRRWLETHGLTLVLVSAMMVVAWMVAAHEPPCRCDVGG